MDLDRKRTIFSIKTQLSTILWLYNLSKIEDLDFKLN